MAPKLVCSRDSRMSSIHMSQLFRFIPFLFSLAALFGCSGGSGGSASAPLSISASGIEGGVILKKASTGEEWTITENGTVSIGDFVLDSDIEISVKPTSALQVCRLNGQSDSVTIRVTDSINIECDNKILFVSQAGLDSATAKLWLLDQNGDFQILVEGAAIKLFSKIGLRHYFQLSNTLWETDGTVKGSVPVELNGMEFTSNVIGMNGDHGSFFYIAKDSDEKAYLFEINSEATVNLITIPEGVSTNDLSIVKLGKNHIFYNYNEKRFITIDQNGLMRSILTLEATEVIIDKVVNENELLILSMTEEKVRKLQAISAADFAVRTIPLPTAPETNIRAKRFGKNTQLFTATQRQEDDSYCSIIYRYNEGAFDVQIDYCNERTSHTLSNIIFQEGRLLVIERNDAVGGLYELSELDLATIELRTLLSSAYIKGGASEIISTESFIFILSRQAVEQDCSYFMLCNYEQRYYSWHYKTGELTELVDSNIESGRQWFAWEVLGNWDFDNALIFGTAFFPYKHEDYGFEPWMTDGTIEGTRIVKDIKPGAEYGLFPDIESELSELVGS